MNVILSVTILIATTGEFGLVYKGYINSKCGFKMVAIKTSKGKCNLYFVLQHNYGHINSALSSEREKENLLKETSKMVSFEHKHVMTLAGVCLDREMPLIIMPFMAKGSVLQYVRNMKENPIQVSQFSGHLAVYSDSISRKMK